MKLWVILNRHGGLAKSVPCDRVFDDEEEAEMFVEALNNVTSKPTMDAVGPFEVKLAKIVVDKDDTPFIGRCKLCDQVKTIYPPDNECKACSDL